jgi:hypothetical protein
MGGKNKKENDVAVTLVELLELVKELVELQTEFIKKRMEEFKQWSDTENGDPEGGESVSTSDEDEPVYSDNFGEEWS